MAEVQKTARCRQKVERRFGIAPCALEDAAALAWPFLGLFEMKQQGKPHRQVVVAQASGTLLQIRLKMKDRVAVLGMTRSRNFTQLLRNRVPLAQHQTRQRDLVKLLIKRELAGQKSSIQGSESEFEVIGIEAPDLLHRPGTGAGPQADIPHPLNDQADGLFRLLLGLLIGKSEQHVDIRIGKKILAPVAAQSQQRNILRGLACEGSAPHFNEDAVHNRGAPANRGSAIPGALTGLADKRHLAHILLPEIVNRESDWSHEFFVWLAEAS